MKHLLLISAIFILFIAASVPLGIGGPNSTLEVLGGFKIDSTCRLPTTYAKNFTSEDSAGRVWYSSSDSSIYYHGPITRIQLLNQHQYIFKIAAINCASLSTTVIGTTLASSGRFVYTDVLVIQKSFSGTVNTQPVISIGTNSSSYNNILPNTTLNVSPTLNQIFAVLDLSVGTNITVAAATAISIKVATAATFSSGGEYTINVYVKGYYETL